PISFVAWSDSDRHFLWGVDALALSSWWGEIDIHRPRSFPVRLRHVRGGNGRRCRRVFRRRLGRQAHLATKKFLTARANIICLPPLSRRPLIELTPRAQLMPRVCHRY